jgi:flagellar assembly protein FliH
MHHANSRPDAAKQETGRMSSPAKFLFDTDFGTTDRGKSAAMLAEHAAALAAAEAAAYRQGFAAAKAETEQHAAAALARIATGLDALNRGLGAVETRLETEAVEVAVAVAKKLASELLAREPFVEIAALASACFRELVAAPHVVVRVNEWLHQAAREELDKTTQACGFAGRLVLLAEPDIAVGDCRIEWADGGVRRELAAVEAAIDEAVARYLAGRRGEPYTPNEVAKRVEP